MNYIKYEVEYVLESEFTDDKVVCCSVVCTKVKPDEMSTKYMQNVLESLFNLKEGAFISSIKYQCLNVCYEESRADTKVENSKDYIELTPHNLDILNDVLMEIEENRCYEGEDAISLEKLKTVFTHKLVCDTNAGNKKVAVRIEDKSKMENLYTLNSDDVNNLRNSLYYSVDKVKLLVSDAKFSMSWLIDLFNNIPKNSEVKIIVKDKI